MGKIKDRKTSDEGNLEEGRGGRESGPLRSYTPGTLNSGPFR